MSLSTLAGSNTGPDQRQPSMATDTDKNGAWDKTREVGSSAVQSGQEFGSTVAQKSKEVYQAVKEKGSAAGEVIADTSRNAWQKTKQTGALVAEKASEFGSSIAEKSKSIYRQATQPAEPPPRQDI
ncbi:hypothetical protein [Sedimenticola sp.]|uniref:hypothetical protein n=1 Tax=Sedimenticola sp. TaxID=1940285 RepID=UPI00258B4A07|nr:hypothetical protein [Sedimenticola sp.]MCW8904422.1 hypothetical protein [Sedimenticola sp.]